MVKIRLRRIGTKGRPFYRIVAAESSMGRNGRFIEVLGYYDPVSQPKRLEVDAERALHWLRNGAEPTETVGYILNKKGVLERFFAERPDARKRYRYLDKRAPLTVPSVSSPESGS
ncbi:MAG: 30S ribosomal protein S16 [Fimbriimonadales bacterium]